MTERSAPSDRVLGRIAALVAGRAGIHLPGSKIWLLQRRIVARQQQLGIAATAEYLALLESPEGVDEIDRLFESLRTGETRFFRQGAHLRALVRVALPEIIAHKEGCGERTIQVWSAGCASGEEPYSIAVVLESWIREQEGRWSYRILATDLSQEALAAAREGLFDANAVRAVPRHYLARHFVREGQRYRVDPALQQRICFKVHNLVTDPYPTGFDLVFCCNVLFYFDRSTRVRVVRNLSGGLAPHGYLFLGSTEALPGDDPLSVLRTPDGIIYQPSVVRQPLPEPSSTAEPPPPGPPPTGTAPQPPRDAAGYQLIRLVGSYADPDGSLLAQQLRPAVRERAPLVVIDLDGATYLHPTCARVLRRLASSLDGAECRRLRIIAGTQSARHWLKRQGILDGIPRFATLAEALERTDPEREHRR